MVRSKDRVNPVVMMMQACRYSPSMLHVLTTHMLPCLVTTNVPACRHQAILRDAHASLEEASGQAGMGGAEPTWVNTGIRGDHMR